MPSKSSKNRETRNSNHASSSKRNIVSCPLCGRSFDAISEKACQCCKKNENCPMVVCPNCFHEFLPT